MTGEMFKPDDADKGLEWWERSRFPRAIGDEHLLIRPNYPEMFELQDALREVGFEAAEVMPFDVYQGPFIELEGIEVGADEGYYASGALTQQMSEKLGSCKIWQAGGGFYLDCGHNNEEFFDDEKGLEVETADDVLETLNSLKERGKLVPRKEAMKFVAFTRPRRE